MSTLFHSHNDPFSRSLLFFIFTPLKAYEDIVEKFQSFAQSEAKKWII